MFHSILTVYKMKRSASKNTKIMASKDNTDQPGSEPKWTPMFMQMFAREWLKHPILLPNAQTNGLSQKQLKTRRCVERRELYDALNIYKFRPWTNLFLKEYKRMLSKKLSKARARTTEQALTVLPEWVRDFEKHFNEIPKVLEDIRSRTDKSPDKSELLLDILRAMWKELRDNGSEGHKLEFWTRAINAASTECGYPKILVRRTWCSVMKVAMQKLRLLQATGDRLPAGSPTNLTTADWLAVDLLLAIEPTETLLHQESLTDYDQLATLTTLFSLAQMYQLDQCLLGTARDSEQRWKDATQAYIHRGFSSSMLVLQRRWCELVQLARGKLAAFQRGGGGAVPPLCKQLAIRFPQLVTCPLPAWGELVASRRVVLPDYADVDARHTPGELASFKPQTQVGGPKDDDIILIEQDIETIDLDGLHSDDEDKLIIDERIKLDKKKLEQRKRLIKEENDAIQSEKKFIEQRKQDMCNRLDSEMDSQLEYINDNQYYSPCTSTSTNVQSVINWQLFNKTKNCNDVDLTESDYTDAFSTLANVGDNILKTEIDITEHNILEKVKSKSIQEGIEKTIQDNDNRNITVPVVTETTNPENMTPNLETLFTESSTFTNLTVLEELDPSNVEAKIIFSDEEDEGNLNPCDNDKDVTSQEAAIPKKQDDLVTQQIAVKQENISTENKMISNNDACIINLDTDSSDSDKIFNKIKTEDENLNKDKKVVKHSSDSINIPKSCLPKKRIGPKSFMQKFQNRETEHKSREERDSTDDFLFDKLLLVDENNGSIPAKSIVDNTEGSSLSESGTVIKKEITLDKDHSNLVIVENTVQIKTEPNDDNNESRFKKYRGSQSNDNNVNKNVNKTLNSNKDKAKDNNRTKTVEKSSFARFSFEGDKSDVDVRKTPIIPMETNESIDTDNNVTIPTSKSKSNNADGNEIVNEELNPGDKVILDKAKGTKLDETRTKTIKKAGIGWFSFEGENSELDAKKTSPMEIDEAGNKDDIPKPDAKESHSKAALEEENTELYEAKNRDDLKKNCQTDYDGWIVINGNAENNNIIPKSDVEDSHTTAALEEENSEFEAEDKKDAKMNCQTDYDGWIVIDGTQSKSSIGQLLMPVQIPLYKIDKLPFWKRHAKNNSINVTKISKNLNPVNGRRLKPGFRPTGWPKPVLRRKPFKRRYNPRDLRNNPDFNVGLKNFSVNFILKHADTLAICKPVTVDIERMPMDVLEEYLEKQNLPKQLRPRKKVELADIEEVRRINKRLLTAQVRPILAKKRPSREYSRRQSHEALSDSDSDVSFVRDVGPAPPHTRTHPPGGDGPDLNTLTLIQLEDVLNKLTYQETQRADQPKGNLYCCPARRHINYNRAKARIAARAGKFAYTINLHGKLGPAHAELKCECCCVNLLRGLEESRKQLHSDMKALHSDLQSLAQIKNNENTKGAALSDAPPAKLAKPDEDSDYTPEEELPLKRRKSKDKGPKRKESKRKKTKDDKNKSEKQKEIVETNEYEEWMRQRNICAKYFTMGSMTSPVAKRPKTTVTFKSVPFTSTKKTVAPNENLRNENVLTADEILYVSRKRETQNTENNTEQTNTENIVIETPKIDNSNTENQQERQTEINNIAEEHSYIKTPQVAIQVIPVTVANTTQNPTQLTIVPMTSQQYDLADEDPMTIILNDKQPLPESESTSTTSEITPTASEITSTTSEITSKTSEITSTTSKITSIASSEITATATSSENTQTASSENTLSVNSRTSSLEDLNEGVVLETIPRFVIQNTNTQDSKENPPLVIKESRVTNSQTGDIPRYVIDKSAAQGQKIIIPFSVQAGEAQKNQSQTQGIQMQGNEILFGNQAGQTELSANQKTFKQHIVTHISGQKAGPASQYWNNAITQPQIKALIETAQVNPGMKFMKVLQCPNKSETVLATCVAKKEDPNQTTLRLITQRSNPLAKKSIVNSDCIDLTDNDELALSVSQEDSSSQISVESTNQTVKSIAQVSKLVRTLGHTVPLKHKQIKIMGPANDITQTVRMVNNHIVQPKTMSSVKQSVETLSQPVQSKTQMNQSSQLSQSVKIVVSQANKIISPVQSMDQVNKMIPTVQSIDQLNKIIPPVQSMDQVNKMVPPVQSMDQVNKMIPTVQTMDQVKQIIRPIQSVSQANQMIQPIQIMSQAHQIVPPVQTTSQANQMISPIPVVGQVNVQPIQTMGQTNQPIIQPILGQGNLVVQPIQTMGQTNQMVQPMQTMGQTHQMLQPIQPMGQANQMVQPIETMGQSNQIVQPMQTMGQANQIVQPIETMGQSNQMVQPMQTMGQTNLQSDQSNQIIQAVQAVEQMLQQQANQNMQPVQNMGQNSQFAQPVQSMGQPNQIIEPVVPGSLANPLLQPYGNIIKPLVRQPIELGIQTSPAALPNPLTGHFITLKYQPNQPAQTTSKVGHGPIESQKPRIVLNIDSINNAGEVSIKSSVATPSRPIILNKYLNDPQRVTTVPPWIKNKNQTDEGDKNILNHSLKEEAIGHFLGGSMPVISDVVGNYDMESKTETVPASFFDKPSAKVDQSGLGGQSISPARVKVLPPKQLPRRKFTIVNRHLSSESAQKRKQEQMQQSLLELKLQLHHIPVAPVPEPQSQPTATEDRSLIRKKKFQSTDLSHGTPHYVDDLVKYILASKMSLSDVRILAVNTTKPLLKLRNQYIVVTESISPNHWLPSFWTLNPPLNFSQIYFTRFGKSPNKVKKFNLDAELSKDQTEKPADKSCDTGRLKVKAFAKLPGTENALTLNESIEVQQSEDEQNKLGKLLVDAQDFMYMEDKCFKKLSDDPLIYAQVFSVLSDVYRVEEQAIAKAPLYLLDTAHCRLNPIQRREVDSEGRRLIGLVCPASPGTNRAIKDLVKLLNTPHDEFGFPRQKFDTTFTSPAFDVTSLGVTSDDVERDVIQLDSDSDA